MSKVFERERESKHMVNMLKNKLVEEKGNVYIVATIYIYKMRVEMLYAIFKI
mgnify:CR=1 FL=1